MILEGRWFLLITEFNVLVVLGDLNLSKVVKVTNGIFLLNAVTGIVIFGNQQGQDGFLELMLKLI